MDLSTTYLGLGLRCPVVASASPLTAALSGVRSLADAGVGAVVLASLFEEEVRAQEVADLLLTEQHEDAFGEARDYLPQSPQQGQATPYLRHLEQVVAAVDIPVIASLNGSTPGGWTSFAASMESAGAAAVELNIYALPGEVTVSGRDVEQRHLDILLAVKAAVSIPVAVKLSPYYSATGAMALAMDRGGADGLVLFNRFLQPAIDTEAIQVVPGLTLSSPADAGLPRAWIALLRHRVQASLAGTTGVERAEDVIAYLLAGADVVMSTSALLRHGASYVETLTGGLESWMQRKGFGTLEEVRGLLAVPAGDDPTAAARAGYVRALTDAQGSYGSPHA